MSGPLEVRVEAPLRDFRLDLELQVAEGRRVALVGPSGAGKTSVLRIVAGLLSPRRGRVSLGGSRWLDTDAGVDLAPERRRCGLLFQDFALFAEMSAWRNVAFGMRGLPRAQRRRAAVALLDRFGVAALAEARPTALSGGERQRVALARALAAGPEVLLLDEPLSALDPSTRSRSMGELDALLAGLGIPVLLVTHSFDEAAVLGDRVAVLDHGSVVQSGTAAEIAARPSSSFVADFAGAIVLNGDASIESDGLTVVRLDGGGELRSTDRASGRVAVSVYPWEVALEPPGIEPSDSALNRLEGRVTSVTPIGNRVRVGMAARQPLSAEITSRSARTLGLGPGVPVNAVWKATATRLLNL